MSDADTLHTPTDVDHHGHHGHAGQPLGPIDLTAWGYALAGSLLGVLAVLALLVARGS